jgi:hypothetical protein
MSDDLVSRLRSPEEIVFPAGTESAVCGWTIRTLEPFSMWSSSSDKLEAADEIERLRARVAVLEQHLRDAVSVADMAMSDANGCDCRAEKKWDREAELRVFRDALEAQPCA